MIELWSLQRPWLPLWLVVGPVKLIHWYLQAPLTLITPIIYPEKDFVACGLSSDSFKKFTKWEFLAWCVTVLRNSRESNRNLTILKFSVCRLFSEENGFQTVLMHQEWHLPSLIFGTIPQENYFNSIIHEWNFASQPWKLTGINNACCFQNAVYLGVRRLCEGQSWDFTSSCVCFRCVWNWGVLRFTGFENLQPVVRGSFPKRRFLCRNKQMFLAMQNFIAVSLKGSKKATCRQ